MKSHEVIKQAISNDSVKTIAARMGLSTSLVYKWCEEPSLDEDPDQSGARNPLDRVAELHRLTGDSAIVSWICEHANGFFVENPKNIRPDEVVSSILISTQGMIKEFSDLLDEISRAIRDGKVNPVESERIRREWEQLKGKAETFVIRCEQGSLRGPQT